MCGRASITKTEAQIEKRFKAVFYPEEAVGKGLFPNQNICPSQLIPVITNADPDHLRLYRWGLIPPWAKDEKIGYNTFNARKETLLDKPAFKKAAHTQRCLVIMDSFYEWKKEGKLKIPYRVFLKDKPLFATAGLWEVWQHPSGELVPSCTIITQPPNQFMATLHDRMPAILPQNLEQLWISSDISATEAIDLLDPIPSEAMDAYEMDPVKGKPDNTGRQMSLFP